MTQSAPTLGLQLRTLSHLRSGQLWYLPLRGLQSHLPVWVGRRSAVVEEGRVDALQLALLGANTISAQRRRASAEAVSAGRFTFFQRTEPVEGIDWRKRYHNGVWTHELQAFGWATDLAWVFHQTGEPRWLRTLETLVGGWLDRAGRGRGPGWDPFTASSRALNWCRIYLLAGNDLSPDFAVRLRGSAVSHLTWLERHLEYHLRAHHLQRNLQALAVGGLLFSDSRAARWRTTALPALWAEVVEQVLPDGGHFERSPLYQGQALADLLEVLALCRARGIEARTEVRERLALMLHAQTLLSRPDGTLHLFNDSVNGTGPSRTELLKAGNLILRTQVAEPTGPFALEKTGYFGIIDPEEGRRLVIDCGAPGPEYQPSHAHCDVLSFELDLGGIPVAVDSGVSGYRGDPLREYVRSTRAHNTVTVAGREQSEIWGDYRMARRARALPGKRRLEGGAYRFEGACRPHFDHGVEHRRTFDFWGESLEVRDTVRGADGAQVTSHLHLHPGFTLRPSGNGFLARAEGIEVLIEPFGFGALEISSGAHDPIQGWYCPEFGRAIPAIAFDFHIMHYDGREFGYRITRLGGAGVPSEPEAT